MIKSVFVMIFCLFSEENRRDDGFYLRPGKTGFCRQVVGIHYLEKIIPDLMNEAGVYGKFTLHSLRSTCATRLYCAGMEEQVIS